jgi:hypothetical protein
MPEQDANRAAHARTKPAPRAEPTEPEEDAAHLSEAARGVVRQSADPRLDAHLARMLSPDETATATAAPPAARGTDADSHGELLRLTAELADARAAAEAAGRRVVSLTLLLGVALLAIVILLVVAVR